MDENDKRDLLKAEYLHIQSIIETFDGRMLTIKAWSVSFGLAALAAAFAAATEALFLIAAFSAVVFWLIEALWKAFQTCHYVRAKELEGWFRGDNHNLEPMQISETWESAWDDVGVGRILKLMSWTHVHLPHSIVFLFGIALYGLVVLGWLPINSILQGT